MEENNLPLFPSANEGCVECGHPVIENGKPTPLCSGCREKFIKFPIPLWIKLFTGGIAVILLFSLYKLPKNLNAGMHMEKGKTAIEEHKYATAKKELALAAAHYPDNIEINCNMMLAAYYTADLDQFFKSYSKVENKNIEDADMFQQLNAVLDKSEAYFPSDEFSQLLSGYGNDITRLSEDSLRDFIGTHGSDVYSRIEYASMLSDRESYVKADSVLTDLLELVPESIPALRLMSSVKRQENKLVESLVICNKMINLNEEDGFALASKSRTLLKQKQDAEAYTTAKAACSLDKDDVYANASLLLACHFLKKDAEKKALQQKLSVITDSSSQAAYQYVQNVMNGKEFFRN